ncbi:hypothetical protein BSLG_009023 [Batrachochytrium salamandrivorans]|nr:hypothetical protein BSLG_009023 [Batrachochytrium salamandrivorans]
MADSFSGMHVNCTFFVSYKDVFQCHATQNWDAKEDDMKVIVPIHNAVNERCWKQILEWKLFIKVLVPSRNYSRFIGRPKDYTPKARFRQLLGYKLPFDRHDWTVDRCGTKVTYVVDFYTGASGNPTDLAFYLDVRPEMSYQGVLDRLTKFWKTGTGLW